MSYETFETLQVAIDGPLAIVTVSREPALNALSSKVISELTAVCGELEVSTDVRVVKAGEEPGQLQTAFNGFGARRTPEGLFQFSGSHRRQPTGCFRCHGVEQPL